MIDILFAAERPSSGGGGRSEDDVPDGDLLELGTANVGCEGGSWRRAAKECPSGGGGLRGEDDVPNGDLLKLGTANVGV